MWCRLLFAPWRLLKIGLGMLLFVIGLIFVLVPLMPLEFILCPLGLWLVWRGIRQRMTAKYSLTLN